MDYFEIVYHTKENDFKARDEALRTWIGKNSQEFVISLHRAFKGPLEGFPNAPHYENDEHYHYYVHCNSSWTLDNLAKSLGVEKSQLQKVGAWKTAILYARHINKQETEGKPLIAREDVFTNVKDYDDLCDRAINGLLGQPKAVMPQCITDYAEHKISFAKMKKQLSFEQWTRWQRQIKDATTYRSEKGVKRDMKVIYINGQSGSGKTTLAKFLGDNMGFDVFVSGSGSDPLDGYDDEECIILDDLRADVFTKAELFKLLDNNTNSSVKSRYFNKAITHCRLMIITSVKTPFDLYNWKGEDEAEPFVQFARRLDYGFLVIEGDSIYQASIAKDYPLKRRLPMYKSEDFDMQVVFAYYNIVKHSAPVMKDILRMASKNARESMEKRDGKKL